MEIFGKTGGRVAHGKFAADALTQYSASVHFWENNREFMLRKSMYREYG